MHPIIFSSLGNINLSGVLSSTQTKLIRSLQQKKYRDRHRLFVVEGEKMVNELLKEGGRSGYRPYRLYATPEWIEAHEDQLGAFHREVHDCTSQDLRKVSSMVTPQPVLALVSMPEKASDAASPESSRIPADQDGPVLAFESIRDPGNLGTILRTANWFGIDEVVCTPDSADLYNPKVVQATMGAIFRVRVDYRELESWLGERSGPHRGVYGTFMEGESIYRVNLGDHPVVLFGNESRGLSDRYDRFLQGRISVPLFARPGAGPESLNIASTVAIVCSEIRRRDQPAATRSGN